MFKAVFILRVQCINNPCLTQVTKRSLDELAVNALEGFDDVVGNTLTPSSCMNACDENEQKYNLKDINSDPTTSTGEKQDPDKIFRQYPSFDPVFMKV